MFEFHGWITVRVAEDEAETTAETSVREDRAIERVRAEVSVADDHLSFFDVRRAGNGLIVLMAHGSRNHRYRPVIESFERVGRLLPDSYGLLYVHDDGRKGGGNEFRVWRLALGKLTEHADPFAGERHWDVNPCRVARIHHK
jgi:hypothetical protein